MATETTSYNVAPVSLTSKREAVQDSYNLALASFLDSPCDSSSIQSLCWAISCHPYVAPGEAECIINRLSNVLEKDGQIPELVVATCELFLRIWLTVENVRYLATSDKIERVSVAYCDLSLQKELPSYVVVHLSQVAALWTELIHRHLMEDFQCFTLVTCAMRWALNSEANSTAVFDKARRVFGDLIVAVFTAFPGARSSLINDVLEAYFRQNQAVRRLRSLPLSSSGFNQGFMNRASGLLLQFVAAAGSVPVKIWNRACSIKDRSLVETEAQKYHLDALRVCNQVSHTITERAYARGKADRGRSAAQSLIEDIANALRSPEWPGAELLVSCFLASLFKMAGINQRDKGFPIFALDMLRTLHDSLWSISLGSNDGSSEDVISELWHLSSQKRSLATLYLASRQCMLPNQPYFDLHSQIIEKGQAPSTLPGEKWLGVLKQWPISHYYSQVSQLILEISRDNDISEKYQVEILKVLDCCIKKDPKHWYAGLLTKLRRGGPSLCDATAQVCGTYLDSRGLDSEKDAKIIDALAQRFGTPGASSYKKRVASMLVEWCYQSGSNDIHIICLKNILKLCSDSEKSVKETGEESFSQLFNEGKGWSGPDALAKGILGVFHLGKTWQHQLRESLAPLLRVETSRKPVQNLVMKLFQRGDLLTAAIFLEENGRCMPLAQLKPIFEIAKNRGSPLETRLASWRILSAAFTCRPRLIVGPRLASEMFSQLKKLLSSAAEPEFEYIGPIMWQLCLLGSNHQTNQRKSDLDGIIKRASATLKNQDLPDVAVYARLAAIVELSRFWPDPEGIRDVDEAAYADARERVAEWVQRFCQIALTKLEKGAALRLMLLRVAFRMCSSYNELFVIPQFKELSGISMEDLYSSDAAQFMELLFSQMWSSRVTSSKKVNRNALEKQLFGKSEADYGEYARMGLFQQHFESILKRVLDEDKQSVTAMQIVARTVDQDRADVAKALPSVVSLTTSSNTELSQIAFWCFEKFCDRQLLLVTKKFPDCFLAAVGHKQKRSPLEALDSDCGLARLWQVLGARSKSLVPALIRLLEALPYRDSDYCVVLTSSLGKVQLNNNDARHLVDKLDIILTGFNCADSTHSGIKIAIMIVTYAFLIWARRHYGLDGDLADDTLIFSDAVPLLEKFSLDVNSAREEFESLRKLRHPHWNSPEFKMILRRRKRGRAVLD